MKYPLIIIAFVLTASSLRADEITTLKGEKFTSVTITRVEPDGIVVRKSDGIVKIPFSDLSPELRAKYGYDPEKAAKFAAADAEAQRRLAQEQAAQQQAAAQRNETATSTEPLNQREYTLWGTIIQILPQGVIVDPSYRGYHSSPFLVKGMPGQDKLAEGDNFHASIVDAGVITLNDTSGAKRTLHAYMWRGPPK